MPRINLPPTEERSGYADVGEPKRDRVGRRRSAKGVGLRRISIQDYKPDADVERELDEAMATLLGARSQ